MNRFFRNLIDIFGIIGIFGICFVILHYTKIFLTDTDLIEGMVTLTAQEWMDESFGKWGIYCVSFSFFCSISWYVILSWFCPCNKWQKQGKRVLWFFLMSVCIGFCVFASYNLPNASSKTSIITSVIFYILSIIAIYFSTARFSPIAYKYVVPGSVWLRRF